MKGEITRPGEVTLERLDGFLVLSDNSVGPRESQKGVWASERVSRYRHQLYGFESFLNRLFCPAKARVC